MKYNFKKRYDNIFEKGTFSKLIDASKKYSRDTYIRVNTSKTSYDEVEKFLKNNRVKFSKTFLPNCIKIDKSFFNLSSSLLALTGKIYIQDIASQIPVNCMEFKGKNLRILDACASPGSKTTQIADALKTKNINYEIIALEPEKKRLSKLLNNLQKQEVRNIKVINVKAQDYVDKEKFDIILVDAPCSGNLVGDRDWLNKRDLNGILRNSKIQKEILSNCIKLLKDGGQMIYSTCSIEPEENEENVKWAINNLKLKPLRVNLKTPFQSLSENNSLRFMPYISKTQGFFVSVLRK